MPTYQYACTGCDNRFEAVQSFSDDALTDCPQCSGRLRKVFNSVGIVFKGSGFYRTDSRDKPGATKPGSGDSPATAPASTGSSETSAGATPKESSSRTPASSTPGSSTAGSAA